MANQKNKNTILTSMSTGLRKPIQDNETERGTGNDTMNTEEVRLEGSGIMNMDNDVTEHTSRCDSPSSSTKKLGQAWHLP